MNVKGAIHKIEQRKERAKKAASRYRDKGRRLNTHMGEYADEDERYFAELKRNGYYLHSFAVEDYLEELEELVNFLKSKEPDDEAVFTSEEEMEDEFGIYGDSDFQNEEWSNTVASVMECRNSGDDKIMWVICMLKSLKDT